MRLSDTPIAVCCLVQPSTANDTNRSTLTSGSVSKKASNRPSVEPFDFTHLQIHRLVLPLHDISCGGVFFEHCSIASQDDCASASSVTWDLQGLAAEALDVAARRRNVVAANIAKIVATVVLTLFNIIWSSSSCSVSLLMDLPDPANNP